MKNKIEITVTGIPNSGKSRITFLIKDYLKKLGFDVEFDEDVDFKSENDFDKQMGRNINNFIKSFRENKKIKIRQQHPNRIGL